VLKPNLSTVGRVAIVVLAGCVGGLVGRMKAPGLEVKAQENFNGLTNCATVVPKSWGEFKGGSQYGLAFEDDRGVVRFVQHPSCGSINSPAEPPVEPIDLEIKRR
jgi:hypothetical protein